MIRVTPDWLALREAADAAARAEALVEPLRRHLAGRPGPLVIRDLGCGTGSMGRWLAGRLPGPQRWVMQDRDPDLVALVGGPTTAADGGPVEVVPLAGDVTTLRATDLADTALVTASALVDLFTSAEVAGIADACTGAGCAALLTISVIGRVELTPADPLDAEVTAAFNAHQRRVVEGGRRLLGPDAVASATAAFQRRGAAVFSRPSPWRLGADDRALTAEWLRGWVGAAAQQRPEPDLAGYLDRRLATCAAGELRAVVHHTDLLALPGGVA
ncbi:MAG TPA: SAM-dependent methyltransferase [Pseudonocardiaceae bacterium]|jgi:hypothetical protein